jgi:hypothetical protein
MVNKKKVSHRKRYGHMNPQQLAEATKDLDQEFIADSAKPLTPQQRRQHQRARTTGRPKVGKGAQRILITMERGLLGQVDAFARHRNVSRSQLIAQSVKRLLAG